MATERALRCSPCDYQHDTTPAVKWCMDCTEALCLSCFGVHKGLKVSRNHNVIGIEDHKALQGIISNLSEIQRCEKHDKPFEYFCPLHDEVVCIKCIQTKHSQCTGWLTISEAADGVKSSVAKEIIKQDIEDMIGNVEELIKNHEKERINNQNACKNLKDEAQKVVRSIIQKVKDLEAEFVKTVDVQHQEISYNISSRTIELKDILQKNQELRDRLNKEPITSMKELQLATPVKSFLSEVTLLCHVKNDSRQIAFRPTKLQQVQSRVSVSISKSIEDIEIQNIVKINVRKPGPSKNILSVVISPKQQLIFNWDESKRFDIYNSKGEFVRYQPIKYNVRYTAIVDTERLAFSYQGSTNVCIFNMRTLKTERQITFKGTCHGLACDSRHLYIVGYSAIFHVDMSDDPVCISEIKVNTWNVFNLSVNGDKLYYTDKIKATVFCCHKNGDKIWSFRNEIMKCPTGITTDKNENIYVACGESHNVIVISGDGKRYKEILNASNGLTNPCCIFYDESEHRLLVCNFENGLAFFCTFK